MSIDQKDDRLAQMDVGTSAFEIADRVQDLRDLAKIFLNSGLMPDDVERASTVVTILVQGHELGIPAMASINGIDVIKGRASISPELGYGIAKGRGLIQDVDIDEAFDRADEINQSDGHCEITITDNEGREFTGSFDMDRARQMTVYRKGKPNIPLAEKANWRSQPEDMLYHRALGRALKRAFPDVMSGVLFSYEAEEEQYRDEDIDVKEADFEVDGEGAEDAESEDVEASVSEAADQMEGDDVDVSPPDEDEGDQTDGEPVLDELTNETIAEMTNRPYQVVEEARDLVEHNVKPLNKKIRNEIDDFEMLTAIMDLENMKSRPRSTVLDVLTRKLNKISPVEDEDNEEPESSDEDEEDETPFDPDASPREDAEDTEDETEPYYEEEFDDEDETEDEDEAELSFIEQALKQLEDLMDVVGVDEKHVRQTFKQHGENDSTLMILKAHLEEIKRDNRTLRFDPHDGVQVPELMQ